MPNKTTILAIAISSTLSFGQVSERQVSSIKSDANNVEIIRTNKTINGLDIFGAQNKIINMDGKLLKSWDREFSLPNNVPAHQKSFDETQFKTMTGILDEIVYTNFVYFNENGEMIPSTHVQVFDGMFTSTLVVEQSSYRVLLNRDETSHAHDNHNHEAEEIGFSYPIFDVPEAKFQYWKDGSPAPASPHPTGIPDGFQANYVNDDVVWNTSSVASPMGWLNLSDPSKTIGNNIIAETEGVNNTLFNDGPVSGTLVNSNNPYVRFEPYYRLDGNWNSSNFLTLQAAAVNTFAHGNLLHDWYYGLGFQEEDGNFQTSNLSRGGNGNDAMKITSVFSHTLSNNAFYSGTEIDGTPGSITMLRFRSSLDGNDRHSGFDSRILAHEYQHGVTRRLVGSISLDQSLSLNEGWSDFTAFMYTLDSTDNLREAVVAIGDWVTYRLNGNDYVDNYYFGFRDLPVTWDMSKNPTTYADTDPNQFHIDASVPRTDLPNGLGPHFIGQTWTLALWDTFVLLNDVYSFEESKSIIMKIVIEGLRLTPPEPTFVEARDAFILADRVLFNGEHRIAIWEAMSRRGLGIYANSPDASTIAGVTESFEEPNWADFNQDGNTDFVDVSEFIYSIMSGDSRADIDWNGSLDIMDVFAFLEDFQG